MSDTVDRCVDCGGGAVVLIRGQGLCGLCFNGRSAKGVFHGHDRDLQTTYAELVDAFLRLSDTLGTPAGEELSTALEQVRCALRRHASAIG